MCRQKCGARRTNSSARRVVRKRPRCGCRVRLQHSDVSKHFTLRSHTSLSGSRCAFARAGTMLQCFFYSLLHNELLAVSIAIMSSTTLASPQLTVNMRLRGSTWIEVGTSRPPENNMVKIKPDRQAHREDVQHESKRGRVVIRQRFSGSGAASGPTVESVLQKPAQEECCIQLVLAAFDILPRSTCTKRH